MSILQRPVRARQASRPPWATLILDDDEFMLRALTQTLHSIGYDDVVATRYAVNALAVLADRTRRIGLVLCDLNLPEIDGIEFIRSLAVSDFDGGVILISGEGQRTLRVAEDLARAQKLDIVGSIVKPVHAGVLATMIREWRERSTRPRAPVASVSVSPEDIAQALRGEAIVAWFQPQVRLRDRKVVAVEALVRWQRDGGFLAPDAFIPVAEEHGLMAALTRRVASYSLARLAEWHRRGFRLRLALNVSMENLKDLAFPDHLLAAIADAGVAPSSVLVEVTESRFMADPIASRDTLARLRLKRVGLAIDDFGTGYASLTQLRDLPFGELKIDRSFVRHAADDPTAAAILESCVMLGKKLGMNLVAEGVETQADWDRVAELGCDLAQGYLIAKPMPAEELGGWLERWR